jgi:hypothetical protein
LQPGVANQLTSPCGLHGRVSVLFVAVPPYTGQSDGVHLPNISLP